MEPRSHNDSRAGPPAGNAREFPLSVAPSTILIILLSIAAGFTLVSGVTRLLGWYVIPPDSVARRIALLFDVNFENNFPSYYSSILLLIAGGLLIYIAAQTRRRRQRDVFHWALLGAIFVFLSMDEMIQLHELLTSPVRETLNATGAFYYAWVIPYAIFALVVALAYLRFLWRLPPRIRMLFFISGVIYVTGAVGMEMVVGYIVTELEGPRIFMLAALEEHVEEFMEMTGVSLFIYALAVYIGTIYGGVKVTFRRSRISSRITPF